jgi:Type VI secretion system/phage-baseplate injector OB domain
MRNQGLGGNSYRRNRRKKAASCRLEHTVDILLGVADVFADERGERDAMTAHRAGSRPRALTYCYHAASQSGETVMTKLLWGKYRGVVVDNADPLRRARLKANVPAVSDQITGWAMPCVPYTGKSARVYGMPPVGTPVWIEFEEGKASAPIWSGCFWEGA